MIKKKRLAAFACATILAFGMASCGKTDETSSSDSSSKAPEEIKLDSEAQQQVNNLADQLEDITLSNKTIKFLSHWDLNPGDGQVVPPNIQMFRDKYDGKIEYMPTTWDERYDAITDAVLSKKDVPDFFPAMDMDGFPKGAIKNIFQPFDDYIDFDSALWKDSKSVNDAFVFNGKHYVAATGAEPQYVCIYNKTTIKNAGLEDPAELYYNDQWTMSKFKEMCEAFTDPDKEQYGLDGHWYSYALNDACGYPIITLENGKLISNIDNPTVQAMQDFMYDLRQSGVCYPGASPRYNGSEGSGMYDYKTLFYPGGTWLIEGNPDSTKLIGDVEAGEIMFVPMPRMDDSDTYYVSSRNNGYHLIAGAPNPEGVVAFLNCTQLCAKETQNISENQLRDSYKWNDDMIKMRAEILELCKTNAVFDFSNGVNDALTKQLNFKNASMNFADPKKWSDVIKENKTVVQTIIDEANNLNSDVE